MFMDKRTGSILFLIVATELIGFGLIIPVLPQLALKFNTSSIMIGLLMASYSIAQFFAAPLLGYFSDKIGRKPVLLLSKFGTVLSYLILAVSQSYTLFLIARLLDGFTGGNISVVRAYVADVTSEKDRPKGMAIIGISFGFGFIIGPAIGGLIYQNNLDHTLAALIAGGASLLAFIFTLLFLKEPKKRASLKKKPSLVKGLLSIKKPAIQIIFAVYFIYMVVFSGFETSFSIFTSNLFLFTTKQNSWLFMYAGILALFIQGGITRFTPKNLQRTTYVGITILAFSFLGLAITFRIWMLLGFLFFLSLGVAIMNTYLPSLLSSHIDDDNQGLVMGLYEGVGSLCRVIGPIMAFTIILEFPRHTYFLYAVLLILGALLLSICLKTNQNKVKD
jgi:MFS transporter, DHA1 family, tetracycline resistance protein